MQHDTGAIAGGIRLYSHVGVREKEGERERLRHTERETHIEKETEREESVLTCLYVCVCVCHSQQLWLRMRKFHFVLCLFYLSILYTFESCLILSDRSAVKTGIKKEHPCICIALSCTDGFTALFLPIDRIDHTYF